MFAISALALIALIVLAKMHKARTQRDLAAEILQAQNNNIIYSDRQHPQMGQQAPIIIN
jgi:hypothetical protein